MHMKKVYLGNAFISVKEYVSKNATKFVCLSLLLVVAIIFGVRSALKITDATEYVSSRFSLWFSLINASGFTFFITLGLTVVSITALFIICSNSVFLSLLANVVLFIYAYRFTVNLSAYLMVLKFAIVPYAVLCLIPYFIISFAIFTFCSVSCSVRAKEIKKYGLPCVDLKTYARSFILPICLQLALCLVLSIVGKILTITVVI